MSVGELFLKYLRRFLCSQLNFIGWDFLHASSRCTWSREELVDEQTGKLVLLNQLQRLLEILFCFSWEPADNVRCYGDARNFLAQEVDHAAELSARVLALHILQYVVTCCGRRGYLLKRE